jgi:hypothetical protein
MEGPRNNRRWWPAGLVLIPMLILMGPPAGALGAEEPPRAPSPPPPPPPPPPLMPGSSGPVPVPRPAWAALRPGAAVMLRVRQVFPCDGFSPGERLLNGRPAIQPGDRFLAEVIKPPSNPPPLVGGTVLKLDPPGRYGRPGRLTLQMTQLVQNLDGTWQPIPWQFDTLDRRTKSLKHRACITALFGLEGGMVGASIAGEVARRNPVFITGGLAVGVLVGLGYASFQRGVEANLEQGDTFEVVVGTTSYQPVPRTSLTTIFPAQDPWRRKGKKKEQP